MHSSDHVCAEGLRPTPRKLSRTQIGCERLHQRIVGMHSLQFVSAMMISLIALPGQSTSADLVDERFELRVMGNAVVFNAERELSRKLGEAASLKRKARKAFLSYRTVRNQIADLEQKIRQGQQQLVGLNAQLANVTTVAANNRLVGAIAGLEGQLRLAVQGLEDLEEREQSARASLSEMQEAYIQIILDSRTLVDELNAAYEEQKNDVEVTDQVAEFSQARGKELTFGPSNTWKSNGRKLAELEETITRERIPLRGDSGTFYATVVVNGEHTTEMVVDSGASLITLPYDLAARLGMPPKADDQRIRLTIADGSTITGYLKTAKSIRVGTFEVNNVKCAVLGPEAVNAEPLLGMSFLGEFQFDLDAADQSLGLIQTLHHFQKHEP
jgi:clan AA aspartic protease (TIGR02281 family)